MATSPAYAKHPEHTITVKQYTGSVKVTLQGVIIAQTNSAIQLDEGNYPTVMYIPITDCRMEFFSKTEHSTHCPFKGDASYWSLVLQNVAIENAVWGYETPFDEVAAIGNHVAFYSDNVKITLT